VGCFNLTQLKGPAVFPGYAYKRFAKPCKDPSAFCFLTSKPLMQSAVASVYGSVELQAAGMLLSTPPVLWGVTEALGLR